MKKETCVTILKYSFVYAIAFLTGVWFERKRREISVRNKEEEAYIHHEIDKVKSEEPVDPADFENPSEDPCEETLISLLQRAQMWETINGEYFNEMYETCENYLEFRYCPVTNIYEDPYAGHYKHIYGREDFDWIDQNNEAKWTFIDRLGALVVADMIHVNTGISKNISDPYNIYAKLDDEEVLIKLEICNEKDIWDYDDILDTERSDLIELVKSGKSTVESARHIRNMFNYVHMIDEKDYEQSLLDPNEYSPLTMRYYKDGTIICEEDGPHNDIEQNVKVLEDAIGWIPEDCEDGYTIYVRNEALMEDIKLIYVDENGFDLLP